MESIKALLSLVSCLIFLGVTSLAGAVTIAPPGVNFSAAGIISITSPDFFNVPFPCNVNIYGAVAPDGSKALISNFSINGSSPPCTVGNALTLPWNLYFPTVAAGTVSKMNLRFVNYCSPIPVTINVIWDNSTNTLSIPSSQPVGKCKITVLSVQPTPRLTVSP
ncbi:MULTISPECIES: alkane oxidation protein activator PraB [unclassified Pseudomonas]|uniref:alkane oxidation protein activator PraB n=1 Tax=unclassified Pseudomonas TaxID=196821 RepID=UPI00114D0804|nr:MULTISPECIES: alkane oxidation protein activator PraB [unclassified Pseudomonas]QIH08206.1 protein activator [Pseudomonas sp. BIOMIG1BAC]